MLTKKEISGIGIEINAQGISRFMVLVTSDGNIKRRGTGRMVDTKDDLYVGITKEPVFQNIIKHVDESIFEVIGQKIVLPNPQGIPCKLILSFKVGEMMKQMIIEYGHQSGYPQEIVAIVKALCEETQPWYEKMKNATHGKTKSFWPFK